MNLTTRLLPQWRALCVSQKVPDMLLPCDVRTRWNSMFNMLEGAITHKKIIDKMTSNKANGLRACELSKDEWRTAAQLHKVLQVCPPLKPSSTVAQTLTFFLYIHLHSGHGCLISRCHPPLWYIACMQSPLPYPILFLLLTTLRAPSLFVRAPGHLARPLPIRFGSQPPHSSSLHSASSHCVRPQSHHINLPFH